MRVVLFTHPSFERHLSSTWHPERPERLGAVLEGVRSTPFEIVDVAPDEIEHGALLGIHSESYVEAMRRFCASGGGLLDADTYAGPLSWEASLRAAGAGVAAIDQLRAGVGDVAFLAVRPPGHHAGSDRAMGFCIFNNVAIAARVLTEGGERVAILDWDVHHGNGTQNLFVEDEAVLYVSLHEYPFYPGSGWLDEVGYGPGEGTIVNLPFPAFTGGDVYQAAFERLVEPVVRQFEADWVLVSAGYDAHEDDPLADGLLEDVDYQAMAARTARLVDPGRTIYFLEGGYNLSALRASVRATLVGASGRSPDHHAPKQSTDRAWRILDLAVETQSRFWQIG